MAPFGADPTKVTQAPKIEKHGCCKSILAGTLAQSHGKKIVKWVLSLHEIQNFLCAEKINALAQESRIKVVKIGEKAPIGRQKEIHAQYDPRVEVGVRVSKHSRLFPQKTQFWDHKSDNNGVEGKCLNYEVKAPELAIRSVQSCCSCVPSPQEVHAKD